MKINLALMVFFLFPLFPRAQSFQIDKAALPIDSLKKVLPLLRDSARVDCLNKLARSYTEKHELHFTEVKIPQRRLYQYGNCSINPANYPQWFPGTHSCCVII